MLRRNFSIFIAILLLTITASFAQNPLLKNEVVVQVKDAANADKITDSDLAIWYSVYNGTYLYCTKFDFGNSKDFGDVFDRQRKIRDKLLPSKTNTFGKTVNAVFEKYEAEDLKFDDNSKNQFIEDLNKVSLGIKEAIDGNQ